MELTYTKHGDYYLPDLAVQESVRFGRFGELRRRFLREHKDGIYTGMLLDDKLDAHLKEIGEAAEDMFDRLVAQMKKAEGVTEQLKAENQLDWIGRMNSIHSRAEEIVLNDLIYN